MSIRIVLVDDQRLFIESLATVISSTVEDIEVVGTAFDGPSALDCVGRTKPDVVLMDVRMPGMDGVEATKLITKRFPDVHVVMLTTYDDDRYVTEALKHNAVGYLLKDVPISELAASIRAVHAGAVLISPAVAARLVTQLNSRSGPEAGANETASSDTPPDWLRELSRREREVLELVALGLDNVEIADRLCIAVQTVKNHVSVIYSKLGVHKRVAAMEMARSASIINTDL
jgi:DNA-binding NarL/FixJ family response regulator